MKLLRREYPGWLYSVSKGATTVWEHWDGIEPHPDERLNSLCATLDTVHGRICSGWRYVEDGIRYEIEVPVDAEIVIDGVFKTVGKGKYVFRR